MWWHYEQHYFMDVDDRKRFPNIDEFIKWIMETLMVVFLESMLKIDNCNLKKIIYKFSHSSNIMIPSLYMQKNNIRNQSSKLIN